MKLAFLCMLKHILWSGTSATNLLMSISQEPHEDIVHIFSGIVRLWLECATARLKSELEPTDWYTGSQSGPWRAATVAPLVSIDTDDTFFDREKNRIVQKVSNVDSALHNILDFCTHASHQSKVLRRGMLDAGVLSLVLSAFVTADFQISSLTDVFYGSDYGKRREKTKSGHARNSSPEHFFPEPIPLDKVQDEASTLTVLVHRPNFIQNWEIRQFHTRRHICFSLIEGLFAESESLDAKYIWSRALFTKITS